MRHLSKKVSFLLMVLLSFCLCWCFSPRSQVQALETNPASLTAQGFEQFNRGNAQQALRVWRTAESGYRKAGNKEGVLGSRVNQSLALQALGSYMQACQLLTSSLVLNEGVCRGEAHSPSFPTDPSQAYFAGLKGLGDVLRVMGWLDESQKIYRQTIEKTPTSADPSEVWLGLGNTQKAIYLSKVEEYNGTENLEFRLKLQQEILTEVNSTLTSYQQVVTPKDPSLSVLAKVAKINLLASLQSWAKSSNFQLPLKYQTVLSELESIKRSDFFTMPDYQAALSMLKVAEQYRTFSLYDRAWEFVLASQQIAQKIQNPRLNSFSLGEAGRLWLAQGQEEKALGSLIQASNLAQSVAAWDSAYQWQQEIGKIYLRRGSLEQAEMAYTRAIMALKEVRGSILAANTDFQLSFREKVAPIYRELLTLLISKPQPKLDKAIDVIQQLQQAELENYLRCGGTDLVSLSQVKIDDSVASFYILKLDGRFAVIVKTSNRPPLLHFADGKTVSDNAENLISNLQNEEFYLIGENSFLPYAETLYNQLIAPAKDYLESCKTVVLTIDSLLQTIPFAMLHDGEKYLVERYSLALTVGGQTRKPQPLQLSKSNVLVAGLSEVSPSFSLPQVPKNLQAMPEVKQEISSLRSRLNPLVLLNQDFTVENLRNQLAQNVFPVLHFTTHGQFSSSRRGTFILAWDEVITLENLYQLIKQQSEQVEPLELLVLSACETAQGDRRAVLGIAGFAAQAGARSTVASLWQVDASSTVSLVSQFYKHLSEGQSKAEALRSAQIDIKNNPNTRHPYYWSPFVVVGSWL